MESLNLSEILNLLAVLGIAAAVAGFMAGLLGVGGGIIMVPALYYAFTVLDFDIATRMHLSVGTSLAIIVPTSIISTKTHMEYDAVDFKMVKSFGVFILLGVIAGRFPGKILHWDNKSAKFLEQEANNYLSSTYRTF